MKTITDGNGVKVEISDEKWIELNEEFNKIKNKKDDNVKLRFKPKDGKTIYRVLVDGWGNVFVGESQFLESFQKPFRQSCFKTKKEADEKAKQIAIILDNTL